MSNDQKPARIRIFKSGALSQTRVTAPIVAPAAESAGSNAPPARTSMLPVMLFLGGCALGGAGFAAWPYLAG